MTLELFHSVQASAGNKKIYLGHRNKCRFCSTSDTKKFRKVAHTFPEALGNKWIISLDECDACNELFSLYEDALVKSVSPFLTFGGTKGRGSKVRQTGRSAGNSVLSHRQGKDGKRGISAFNRTNNFEDSVTFDPTNNHLHWSIDIPPLTFRPQLAYKSLVKMALGILPNEECGNFQKLFKWIAGQNNPSPSDILKVGISFGSWGNAPPLISAALIKRAEQGDHSLPYMIFLFCAGSLCFQIWLKSDNFDGNSIPVLGIKYSNTISNPISGERRIIRYSAPREMDWSNNEPEPQPLEKLAFTLNPASGAGQVMPIFRSKLSDV